MERRYSVPPPGVEPHPVGMRGHSNTALNGPSASEDLHAWSIYRQNLNSDFTDSALGSSEKSPLPYGNFQLRESTVQSILSHPRYGPKSALGSNMYTYLKFGLPRVFPPSRGPRDGSSGYDSSDDGSPYLHHQGRNYLRSKSDPDFRNQPLHRPYSGHGPRSNLMPNGNTTGRGGEQWGRIRSSSEANLLSQDVQHRQHHHRRSVHDLRTIPNDFDHGMVHGNRHMMKANSHSTLLHNGRHPSHLNMVQENSRLGVVPESGMLPREAYYPGMPEPIDAGEIFNFPHLQVRGLEVESKSNKRLLLLQGLSFEVRGGEIMAIMATSEDEGTCFLDAVSGRSSNIGKFRGDIMLNGHSIHSQQLRERVAYVQNDSHLSPDLSVKQTLTFHNWLRQGTRISNTGKINMKDRIESLVEDLGLEQVRNTKVSGLTTSEKRRLNVACHLLLDTDIVVLDQPTRGMDIFDTFFLVEFLRQWTSNGVIGGLPGGRIVILTLHPPTYEIFTMLSRVLLISAGRLMFGGRRRDMLPYFAMVDYPCPAFKNPSDYYLDLVTLDDLSAEAMLESSQRIEQLAEMFRRRQEPISDPGPRISLPPKIKRASCFTQMLALFTQAMIYSQPVSIIRWVARVILAASLSLVLGAVFWDLPTSDPMLVLGDRLYFHYTMAAIAPWPILLTLSLGDSNRERWPVERDIRDGLYGRMVYIFTKLICSLPGSICVWLAYLIPAYSMSGLHIQGYSLYGFGLYVGYMLLYLLGIQMMPTALGYFTVRTQVPALISGVIVLVLVLVTGIPLHLMDIGQWASWVEFISPLRLMLPVIARQEHQPEALILSTASLMCRNKQVQHQDIIVQLPCPPPNGTAALSYYGYLPVDSRIPRYAPPVSAAIFWLVWFCVACIAFLSCRFRPAQPRNNPNKP